MYLYASGIDFAFFYDFDIWLWNCYDSVVFSAFLLYYEYCRSGGWWLRWKHRDWQFLFMTGWNFKLHSFKRVHHRFLVGFVLLHECVCFVDSCLSFCLFFFWSLCWLSFFNLRILIAPLVSSNSSCTKDIVDVFNKDSFFNLVSVINKAGMGNSCLRNY